MALFNCLKIATANLQRAECYRTASQAWQNAVPKDFQKLRSQLPPDLQELLQEEQKAWEKFKDEREKFVLGKYGKRKGSGYLTVRILELMKPFKERALELENRLENNQTEEKPNE